MSILSQLYIKITFIKQILSLFADFCIFIDAGRIHFYFCHVTNCVLLVNILRLRFQWLPTFTLNIVLPKHYSKINRTKKNYFSFVFFSNQMRTTVTCVSMEMPIYTHNMCVIILCFFSSTYLDIYHMSMSTQIE